MDGTFGCIDAVIMRFDYLEFALLFGEIFFDIPK